ncbi:winged helix-turn-helix transcriptional regulator [Bradyrhizobium sp. 153]|uniref:winged helix-turn-helix transcriptional regulator n=1 Tax=Bradyrhizobium sp. 153 TaxID=2782627 RepID=UPI001FFBD027|nr:winged helix-turn-helix transcriptional regulator [Bradyrhizobium sp. 153]
MRHIREVLRLHDSVGISQRAVARSLALAQGTVSKYVNRARRAGLTWPLSPELDEGWASSSIARSPRATTVASCGA